MALIVEQDGQPYGVIYEVGKLELRDPRNVLATGGYVVYFGDEIAYVSFIDVNGEEQTMPIGYRESIEKQFEYGEFPGAVIASLVRATRV